MKLVRPPALGRESVPCLRRSEIDRARFAYDGSTSPLCSLCQIQPRVVMQRGERGEACCRLKCGRMLSALSLKPGGAGNNKGEAMRARIEGG
jgi:hypothetical protein